MATMGSNGGGWEIRIEQREIRVSFFVQIRQDLAEGGRFELPLQITPD